MTRWIICRLNLWLEEALKRIASLPQDKQDHLAATLLAEIEADER